MPASPERPGGRWRLVPFITRDFKCPVREFLQRLRGYDPRSYLRFRQVYRPMLEELGPLRGRPVWGDLGDDLGEVRWHCKNHGKPRIYGSAVSGRRIVLLFGDIKRWQEFADADRRRCLAMLAEFHNDYDEESRFLYYRARHPEQDLHGLT